VSSCLLHLNASTLYRVAFRLFDVNELNAFPFTRTSRSHVLADVLWENVKQHWFTFRYTYDWTPRSVCFARYCFTASTMSFASVNCDVLAYSSFLIAISSGASNGLKWSTFWISSFFDWLENNLFLKLYQILSVIVDAVFFEQGQRPWWNCISFYFCYSNTFRYQRRHKFVTSLVHVLLCFPLHLVPSIFPCISRPFSSIKCPISCSFLDWIVLRNLCFA
jgi:hypothetical protein